MLKVMRYDADTFFYKVHLTTSSMLFKISNYLTNDMRSD